MALIQGGPVKSIQDLRCDKLSFTVKYEKKAKQSHVATGLSEMIHCKLGSPYSRRPYRFGIKMYEPDFNKKLRALVQWDPYHESIPFVRVDLNPSYADMESISANLITSIPTWQHDISTLAAVTRFDAAIDIMGVCPDELLAYYPGKQISSTQCKSGRMETYTIGKRGEDNFVVLYDKRLEIKEKNAKYGLKTEVPDCDVTRIEIRMKPDCSFVELFKAKNPFSKLILKTHYPVVKSTELWRLFIATARFEGLQCALQRLDPATRLKFQKRVQEYPSLWWDPIKVWKTWPEVVTGLCKSLLVDLDT